MFNNNCDSKTNGEYVFYNRIKNSVDIIFDIECRKESEFLDFEKKVHYFDPESTFVEELSNLKNSNLKNSNSSATFNDVVEYLKRYGFHKFSYLTSTGTQLITDFQDHYQYCKIVCVNLIKFSNKTKGLDVKVVH